MTTAPNSHELAARQKKARRIAAVVIQVAKGMKGTPSEVARWMRPDERATACRIAGVNPASETTWEAVIELLESSEEMASVLAGHDTGKIGHVTLRRVGL